MSIETQNTWRVPGCGLAETGTSGSGTSPSSPCEMALERSATGSESSRLIVTAFASRAPAGPVRTPARGCAFGARSSTTWNAARPPRGATSAAFHGAGRVFSCSLTYGFATHSREPASARLVQPPAIAATTVAATTAAVSVSPLARVARSVRGASRIGARAPRGPFGGEILH